VNLFVAGSVALCSSLQHLSDLKHSQRGIWPFTLYSGFFLDLDRLAAICAFLYLVPGILRYAPNEQRKMTLVGLMGLSCMMVSEVFAENNLFLFPFYAWSNSTMSLLFLIVWCIFPPFMEMMFFGIYLIDHVVKEMFSDATIANSETIRVIAEEKREASLPVITELSKPRHSVASFFHFWFLSSLWGRAKPALFLAINWWRKPPSTTGKVEEPSIKKPKLKAKEMRQMRKQLKKRQTALKAKLKPGL